MNDSFLLLIAIGVIGMLVQWKLRSVFKKYSKVMFSGGLTGREVAEKMLRDNGITDVSVVSTRGSLTDHYNPSNKTVNLSEDVYNSNSVSAAAVAAHECGHAVQHAEGYAPLKLRSALVPITQFSSKYAFIAIMIGVGMMYYSRSSSSGVVTTPWVFWLGIGMMAVAALFSIVTLPVEYNASNRAMSWLTSTGTLNQNESTQAREALTWAARTYLVAALSAIATIIYYISIATRR